MKADEGQEEDEQSRQGFHLDPLMVMDLFPKLSHGSSPSHRSCPLSKVLWKKRVFGQQQIPRLRSGFRLRAPASLTPA